VSLGGAYEEPEDPQAAAIAKIARQIMTRLHIQVNQTIQFYRGQQGGSAPERLFLSGGASVMPYMAQFFAEKLNLPVDYFNPLRNIEIDPALDLEDLSKYAHSFGEVVGLGLRDLAHCPVELNLMPKSSIQRQEFAQKKPYLVAAVLGVALAAFLVALAEGKIAEVLKGKDEEVKKQLADLTQKNRTLKQAVETRTKLFQQAQGITEISDSHFSWMKILGEMRQVMLQAETSVQPALTTANDGQRVDVGVWVDSLTPELPAGSPWGADTGTSAPVITSPSPGGRSPTTARYTPPTTGRGVSTGRGPVAVPIPAGEVISNIDITCKGVDRRMILPSANSDLAYAVRQGLKQSESFSDAKITSQMQEGKETNLFSFTMTVSLKHPLKL
jgi:type IV pilus assembly protein PilM